MNVTKVSCIHGRSPPWVPTPCTLRTRRAQRAANFCASQFVFSFIPGEVKKKKNDLAFALVGCGGTSGFGVTLLFVCRWKEGRGGARRTLAKARSRLVAGTSVITAGWRETEETLRQQDREPAAFLPVTQQMVD